VKRDDSASDAGPPIGRAGTPDAIALAIAFLFAEQAGYISGSLNDIDSSI